MAEGDVFGWLMDGDPAIRWQVMRDLLEVPEQRWQAERRKVARAGWGARLLALQEAGGGWGGGLYSPKWTSTTYTLLTLRDLGLPGTNAAARRGARLLMDHMLGPEGSQQFDERLRRLDLCIVGMLLSLGAVYGVRDARLAELAAHLLGHQMDDGGWNCNVKKRGAVHGSFNTTFNALDGLQDYREAEPAADAGAIGAAQQRATEFMLIHKLFRSDKTNRVIRSNFVMFSFPPRWYYDVLRGLDYFQRVRAPRDARFGEAIELVRKKQRADGTWPLQNRHAGRAFFEMERAGQPSRWNTLRALRVLRWWTAEHSSATAEHSSATAEHSSAMAEQGTAEQGTAAPRPAQEQADAIRN